MAQRLGVCEPEARVLRALPAGAACAAAALPHVHEAVLARKILFEEIAVIALLFALGRVDRVLLLRVAEPLVRDERLDGGLQETRLNSAQLLKHADLKHADPLEADALALHGLCAVQQVARDWARLGDGVTEELLLDAVGADELERGVDRVRHLKQLNSTQLNSVLRHHKKLSSTRLNSVVRHLEQTQCALNSTQLNSAWYRHLEELDVEERDTRLERVRHAHPIGALQVHGVQVVVDAARLLLQLVGARRILENTHYFHRRVPREAIASSTGTCITAQ